MPAEHRKITFVAKTRKSYASVGDRLSPTHNLLQIVTGSNSSAMEEERSVGDAAADDVIVTTVLEAELPMQSVGRERIVAREDVRARECALYLFCARINAEDLPPAAGER